jgi:hypothetical protein
MISLAHLVFASLAPKDTIGYVILVPFSEETNSAPHQSKCHILFIPIASHEQC